MCLCTPAASSKLSSQRLRWVRAALLPQLSREMLSSVLRSTKQAVEIHLAQPLLLCTLCHRTWLSFHTLLPTTQSPVARTPNIPVTCEVNYCLSWILQSSSQPRSSPSLSHNTWHFLSSLSDGQPYACCSPENFGTCYSAMTGPLPLSSVASSPPRLYISIASAGVFVLWYKNNWSFLDILPHACPLFSLIGKLTLKNRYWFFVCLVFFLLCLMDIS